MTQLFSLVEPVQKGITVAGGIRYDEAHGNRWYLEQLILIGIQELCRCGRNNSGPCQAEALLPNCRCSDCSSSSNVTLETAICSWSPCQMMEKLAAIRAADWIAQGSFSSALIGELLPRFSLMPLGP